MNLIKSIYPVILLTIFSFSLQAQTNCSITNVQVEVQDCDTTDMFYVHIAFDVENPGNQGFVVFGNGVIYDTLEYGEPFYEIGPLAGDCTTLYEFVVSDLAGNGCQGVVELNNPICCPKMCRIEVVQTDIDTACMDGLRRIYFDVTVLDPGTMGFDLTLFGNVLEHYEYGQGPYFYDFAARPDTYGVFVRDTEFPECDDRLEVQDWIDCPDAPGCPILNIPQLEFECTSDTTYNAIVFFEYPGSDDSVFVYLRRLDNSGLSHTDIFFGYVETKGFPFTIPVNLPINGQLYELYVGEQDNPFCFDANEWNDPPDCSGFFDCEISEVIAELHACNDTSNLVFVDIAFEVDNPVSDSFEIRGNGNLYGVFPYGEPFYTVGPIEANCDANYEFIVIDRDDPDCFGETFFDEPPCCACEIFDVVVDPGNCTGDGLYELYLDFEYQNVSGDQFDVYSGGSFIGTYNLGDLPITINEFPERDAEYDVIQICPSDNPDCCLTYEFIGTDCTEALCEIFDVFAEVSECDADGFVTVDVEFDFDNPSSDEFYIVINSAEYGPFMYGQTFYTVGPFMPNCEEDYFVEVFDSSNDDCYGEFEFDEPLCCEEGPCEINFLGVDPLECTGDGIYSAFVNFSVDNPTSDLFDVYSQGTLLGTYNINNLPVLVPNVPEREVEYDIITVCINDNPDCCETIEFMGLDCTEEEEPCSISNLSVDPIQCTGNGTYSIWLEFDFENVTNDFFDVYAGDELVGFYPFSEVPLIIEDFPQGEGENQVITVCVNDNEMCCAELEFTGLDCIIECSISNISVDPLECTDEGTYSVVVDFDYEGTTNDFFEVWSQNIYLGFYAFEDLPITINNFPERDAEYDIITICQNDSDNCCASHEFIGLDCTEEELCLISNVVIDLVECTGVGTYSLFLNFDYENVTNSQFDVFSDGALVGTYAYADLPVFIEAFPERDAEFDFMVICDNDNPQCCSGFEFLGLNCEEEEECIISEVIAEASECDENGLYYVDIAFSVQNPTSNGFEVRGNGQLYGTFEYGEPFYTIGPLEGNCDLIREFVIIDLENEDCQGVFVFDEPICCDENECMLSGLIAEASECTEDGTYTIEFAFEYENPGEGGFKLIVNGIVKGFYSYGQPVYTVDDIDGNCDFIPFVLVVDNDNPDCSIEFQFEEPICCEEEEACFIGNVEGEQYECEEGSNLILVDIWFDYENEGESGFTIRGNGMVYDTFEYGQEFYTVGPIEADCETTYEFIVSDLENPDCSSFFFFADPPCCEEEACAVEGIIEGADCVDDVYIIEYNLEYEGTNEIGFDLYIWDDFFGFFTYEDLPLELEINKNIYPSPFYLTACENDNPDCCSTILFDLNEVSVSEFLPSDAIQVLLRDEQLQMNTELTGELRAHLIALDGRRLQSQFFNVSSTMNLSGYPAGMYILFVETEAGIYTEKIAFIR